MRMSMPSPFYLRSLKACSNAALNSFEDLPRCLTKINVTNKLKKVCVNYFCAYLNQADVQFCFLLI